MTKQILRSIYSPKNEEGWYFVETDIGFYSLRMGGFKREDFLDLSSLRIIETNCINATINTVYSDDEWLYLLLDNGTVISHGWSFISSDGDTAPELRFSQINSFDKDFFNSNFKSLSEGRDGWSK